MRPSCRSIRALVLHVAVALVLGLGAALGDAAKPDPLATHGERARQNLADDRGFPATGLCGYGDQALAGSAEFL
jgi:hypothetical protein